MRQKLPFIAVCAGLVLAALLIHSWLSAREEQQRLASTLAAQKQLLNSADAREHARAATLDDALAQIAALKRATQTPQQILRDLPKYLPLPQPITLAQTPPTTTPALSSNPTNKMHAPGKGIVDSAEQGTSPAEKSPAAALPASSAANSAPPSLSALPTAPAAQIPASDLKPLYDFVQDCRACQAKLAAARANTSDDVAKIAALTRERDAAIRATKGGSFLLRLRRNALWFVIGAAGGYAAAHR